MTELVYLSIDDAPLDTPDEPLGDFDAVGVHEGVVNAAAALSRVPNIEGTTSPPYVIPYTRALALGDFGRDVIGAKRAIWHANGRSVPAGATETFGPIAVRELKKFQRAHGLGGDGVLGPATLKKLAPFFDAYAYMLYVGYPPNSTVADRIVAYCMWGYNSRGAIGYAQYRPMAYMNELQHVPINEDCSTFDTKAYKFGKGPDPNGLNFDGYGNTGTQRQHGRLVRLSEMRPADLVHYDNPQHVAVAVSSTRVVEHGSSAGPLLVAATYRTVVQVRRYI